MTFGKRQLLIGTLVVALGAAVYLNWQFSGSQPVSVTDETAQTEKQLGQTVYVNTEVSGQTAGHSDTEGSSNEENSDGEAQETMSEDRGALADEREKRSQAHIEALDGLRELADDDGTTDAARLEAVRAAEELASAFKAEGDIEAEIRAKGFSDCLVSINNASCTVILAGSDLDDAAVIKVKDIVNRHAGLDFDRITVTMYRPEASQNN